MKTSCVKCCDMIGDQIHFHKTLPHCFKCYWEVIDEEEKSKDDSLNKKEPPSIPNNTSPIWSLVVKDMIDRDVVGRKKHGTPLQINNGRDSLVDAYQEALDLVVYLRKEIEERKWRDNLGKQENKESEEKTKTTMTDLM